MRPPTEPEVMARLCFPGPVSHPQENTTSIFLFLTQKGSMISMTLGRPMSITKTDALAVPLPPCEDGDIFSPASGETRDPSIRGQKMEFFTQSLKLYYITEEMLSTVYSRDPSNPFAPRSDLPPQVRLDSLDLTTILRIDNTLRKWKEMLPEALQMQSVHKPVSNDPLQVRLANILQLRSVL